nr:hypothetical protein BgiMline_003905 [Biomphalaria glabrata]
MYWPSPDDVIETPKTTSKTSKTLSPKRMSSHFIPMDLSDRKTEDVSAPFLWWPKVTLEKITATIAHVEAYVCDPLSTATDSTTGFLPG